MVETMRNNGCSDPSCTVLQIVAEQIKRIEDLYINNTKSIQSQIQNQFTSVKEFSVQESNRINALRAVDIEAVKVANDRAVKQAELLASQMVENAEVLRKSVESTASAIALQLQQLTTQQDVRFVGLERAQWEDKGKTGASPDLQALVTELINSKNENKGIAKGATITKGNIITAITTTVAIITIMAFIFDKIYK